MRPSPFLNDPQEQVAAEIARAVASPMEAVRVIHLRAAEHWAALARQNGSAAMESRPSRKPRR